MQQTEQIKELNQQLTAEKEQLTAENQNLKEEIERIYGTVQSALDEPRGRHFSHFYGAALQGGATPEKAAEAAEYGLKRFDAMFNDTLNRMGVPIGLDNHLRLV